MAGLIPAGSQTGPDRSNRTSYRRFGEPWLGSDAARLREYRCIPELKPEAYSRTPMLYSTSQCTVLYKHIRSSGRGYVSVYIFVPWQMALVYGIALHRRRWRYWRDAKLGYAAKRAAFSSWPVVYMWRFVYTTPPIIFKIALQLHPLISTAYVI